MTSLWHVIVSSLLMAWVFTAVAWAVAGVAVASWGGIPLWIGAVAGAAAPIVGVGVLALFLMARRRASRPAHALAQPVSSLPSGHGGSTPGWGGRSPEGGLGASDTPVSGFGQSTPLGAGAWTTSALPSDSHWATPIPEVRSDWGLAEATAGWASAADTADSVSRATAQPGRAAHPQLFAAAAALIAFGILVTLFVGTWVRVTARDISFSLGAWDLGLGELVLVTILEFAALAALAAVRRTRWLGVLAVFAGTWWLLLWWVVEQIGGGVRHLVRDVRVTNVAVNVSLRPGAVWVAILVLGAAMTAWGLSHLFLVHAANRAGR